MEWLPCVLVLWTSVCLIVHSHGSPIDNLFMVYIRKNMSLKIKPNGEIKAAPGSPTLFNLMRVEKIPNKEKTGPRFSIEAVAAGKFICMNKSGDVYLADKQVLRRKRRRHRRNGTVGRRSWLPKDCHFGRTEKLSSPHMYQTPEGIFSAHSNETVGRFLAFSRKGVVKSVRHPFKHLGKSNLRILVKMGSASGLKYDDILNNTIFGCDKDMNQSVRKCIREIFDHSSEKVRHPKFRRVIRQCKKTFDEEKRKRDDVASNVISDSHDRPMKRCKIQQNSFQRNNIKTRMKRRKINLN